MKFICLPLSSYELMSGDTARVLELGSFTYWLATWGKSLDHSGLQFSHFENKDNNSNNNNNNTYFMRSLRGFTDKNIPHRSWRTVNAQQAFVIRIIPSLILKNHNFHLKCPTSL